MYDTPKYVMDKDTVAGEITEAGGWTSVEVRVGYHTWYFASNKEQPLVALPLKMTGGISHQGWDIPTNWAVDANDVCWVDNAHGPSLHIVSVERLVNAVFDSYGEDDTWLISNFGLKPAMPVWMITAFKEGWTPPEGFNKDDYREVS